jgi:hypothetical protein
MERVATISPPVFRCEPHGSLTSSPRRGSCKLPRPLTIGITVKGGDANAKAAIWSYGIGQNVAYLALLFQRMPEVAEVVLVAGPPGGDNVLGKMFGLKVVQLVDAVQTLDVIIELGSRALSPEQAAKLRRRGGRLVSYVAGNFAINNFQALADSSDGGDFPILGGFDAVWITPQNARVSAGMARMTRSPQTHIVPHIWSPYCIETAMMRETGPAYWRPRSGRPARLGVFEPNLVVTKTFHLPLLSAEEAYRANPSSIGSIMLFNTFHLANESHVKSLVKATDLGRDKKISVEKLKPLPSMMGKHVDLVVSHQWELNLNYLYWDVMYLGWPLVHSSEAISEYGYFYPSFDAQAGGHAIARAIETHDDNIDAYREATRELLWTFSIENPTVVAAHRALLEDLFAREAVS